MTTIVILLILGAVLMFLETLLPGLIAGIIGFICLLVAVFLGYGESFSTGNVVLGIVIVGLTVGTWAWLTFFPESRMARRFVSHHAVGDLGVEKPELLHGSGTALTQLRPSGVAQINGDDEITGFEEKPPSEHWINGGFFAFEPGALSYLTESSVLEREPLAGLASDRQLRAYRHTGFWDCMDTYKDAVLLNDLWERGDAPWRTPAS